MDPERQQIETLLAQIDRRLDAVMSPVARAGRLAVERAKDRKTGVIPPYRLPYLQNLLNNLVADVFGASAGEQFDADGVPQTPIAEIIGDAINDGAGFAVRAYNDDIQAYTGEGTNVRQALLRGRPQKAPKTLVDTARTWVDPNGYRLADRLWQNGQEVRSAIDQLLEFHIGQGTDAATVGKELEQFLTVGGRRESTRTPYGSKGLYAPRRLARTETARAYGRATDEVAQINPWVTAVGWRLSASHPRQDECDKLATQDRDGLGPGNYKPGKVPTFPNHPNDLCYLVQVPVNDPERIAKALGKWARGEPVPELDGKGELPADADTLVSMLTGIKQPAKRQRTPEQKAQRAARRRERREAQKETGIPARLGKPGSFASNAQAEEWGRAAYPHMEFDFLGCDLVAVNETMVAFEREAARWPDVAQKVRYIGTYAGRVPAGVPAHPFGNAFAHAHYRTGEAIGLNPRWYGDAQRLAAELAECGRVGWLTPGAASIDGVFTHEWGHLIDAAYNSHDAALTPEINLDGRGLVSHLWQTWKGQNKATRALSDYAITAPVENISEGYAAIVGQARKTWPAYVKELDRILTYLRDARKYGDGEWVFAADAATSDERRQALERVNRWWDEVKQKARVK